MYCSGIDLHTDNSFITTQDDTGSVVKRERAENVDQDILAYFHSLPGPHIAVVESTSGWYWLNDPLEANGIELVLAHAKYLKIAFTEAAVNAIQYYPEFKTFYQRLARRTHQAIARTIVARELARIVCYILKSWKRAKVIRRWRMSTLSVRPLAKPERLTGRLTNSARLDWEGRRCADRISETLTPLRTPPTADEPENWFVPKGSLWETP